MEPASVTEVTAEVHVRNVGGIDETTVSLPPGVNVLTGRNATNRTSFLKAIMGALGSDAVPLKADAEEGEVSLTLGDETYTRQLVRENGTVVTSGDPGLDDPELAELFAFLLESNEARRAIRRGADLRDVIMRPVDTEAIRRQIDDLREERQELDDRLEELESLSRERPDLEARRHELDEQLEEKRAALEAKESEIEAANTDLEESKARKQELQEQLDELQAARSDLERVRFRIDSQEESLEALRNELDDIEATNASLSGAPDEEAAEIEAELEQLRSQKTRLDGTISELQSIVNFNEEMLEGDSGRLHAYLDDEPDEAGDVTDQLVTSETVTCWTCGTSVDQSAVESTVDRLRSLRRDLLDERSELQAELDDLEMERDRLAEQRKQLREMERRHEQLTDEIDDRESKLAELRDERESLRERVESLEDAVDALPDEDYGEVVDLNKEANQLEFDIQQLEEEHAEVESRLDHIERELSERETLEAQVDTVDEELADLRTKVEQIEADAVEQFNEHMAAILELLDYDNLERIWIERLQREVKEGRQKAIESVFELHVVRQTESGTAYEDTVDHLSESEREVTGLVFALAGYLVHEVYETVPFMLLDSLEAIDADRIASVVDYFADYAPHLVVALLPEDSEALADEYNRVRSI
ncbi:archaea-specific SMC-related protein [Halorarius litoreus]|uniref:archaea-specific SMC-related protein n=1 Tax=Halorarius litoreus TaxID=2962676 RepID=UPI0020CD3E82|nr:archaea-specific SMC-related protein [Halorarius litoreus]